MEEAVPRASDWVGGEVGRRERIDLLGSRGCSKTYCQELAVFLFDCDGTVE